MGPGPGDCRRWLDRLFSTRTRAIIENSMIVADAYLQEHAQMIRGDWIKPGATVIDVGINPVPNAEGETTHLQPDPIVMFCVS